MYAEVVFDGINEHWQKVSSDITSDTTDFKGEVVVQLVEPGTVTIDSLSLFPGGNIKKGWQNPYPFRMDLLQHLKDLNPRCDLTILCTGNGTLRGRMKFLPLVHVTAAGVTTAFTALEKPELPNVFKCNHIQPYRWKAGKSPTEASSRH